MGARFLWYAVAVALAGAGLAVATAFAAVHANDPPPRQRDVPLVSYVGSS